MLTERFFRAGADDVARNLLGKTLVRQGKRGLRRLVITETEAYLGAHDLACHAARGRTRRTEVMFGPPGIFYVYLIYGLHWMLNVVTGAHAHPAAVLIRGLRGLPGPGRLTRELMISGDLNGLRAAPTSGLWFEDHDLSLGPGRIIASPRVGVDYAGPLWSAAPLRFVLAEEEP
jgi:DNA-3-methyladenine glycosylase